MRQVKLSRFLLSFLFVLTASARVGAQAPADPTLLASRWRGLDSRAVTWVFLPGKEGGSTEKMTLHTLIRPEHGGSEVVAGSEPATVSTALQTAQPGRVVLHHLDLLPSQSRVKGIGCSLLPRFRSAFWRSWTVRQSLRPLT
jgi:hypothetical protein